MTQDVQQPIQVVHDEEIAWAPHPRFSSIRMKPLLTSLANPLASVSRVQVPPGGVIGWHQHAAQTETVYVLAGESTLTLGQALFPFGAGQIVAIPPGTEHTLRNDSPDPVELLCFFTPPVG